MIEGMVVWQTSKAGLARIPNADLNHLRQENSSVEERNGC